ncbi:IgGFc-binding protein-like [Polymixia lowei]
METGGIVTLFNGRTGTVSAMGAYEIIAHCDQSGMSEWFRVVAKVQECSLTGLKSVVAVYVFFSDQIVTVTDKHETWVNGIKVTLPSQLKNDVSVKVFEKTIVIEKQSGLWLSYSHSQEVTVSVSDSMAGKVCGACGSLLSSRDTMYLFEDTMQEYMAAYVAQDFPTCGL